MVQTAAYYLSESKMSIRGYSKLLASMSLLLILFAGLLYWNSNSLYNHSMIPPGKEPVIISLDRATSAYQFTQILAQKKLIASPKLFVQLIRMQDKAMRLKAGVYQIKPGETAQQFLDRVVAGDVLIQHVTIIAGTTQKKIAQDLSQMPYLDYKAQQWESIKDGHANAEGMLLAETYQYRGGSSAKDLLEQAHKNLIDYLNWSWSNRDQTVPYKSPYEMLIAASIIEKETGVPDERQLISGVMVNRLKKGMPLQMDPTVIYALQDNYKGKLSHQDMQYDSPYNSYRYRGLPPTPIAMVGKESIDAAAHPHLSNYLYFVAKGNGTHQFSETYEQQRHAITRYQHKDS